MILVANQDDFILPEKGSIVMDGYKPFRLETKYQTYHELYDVEESFEAPEGYVFKTLRDCRDYYSTVSYKAALQGMNLLNWSRINQYCGVCGNKYSGINADKSKKCDQCGHLQFPQTSLAVITAIIKDDQILLAHNAKFPEGLYSLIAGFVEIGETLEAAVEREIMEEVGLKVKNIQYFGSQPWPFPNSMMIGFVAEYESGDINTDDIEIVDANWYTEETFPKIPDHYSIARQIIEYYKRNNKK